MKQRQRKFVDGQWLFLNKKTGQWTSGRARGAPSAKNVGLPRPKVPWADPSGPGELWALRIAKGIEKNPGAVKNKALKEQALAYAAVGRSFAEAAQGTEREYWFSLPGYYRDVPKPPPSEAAVARSLRQGQYELSGWAKRVVKMSLGEDAPKYLEHPEKFDITPAFLERWDKAARANKIVRSAKFHRLSMETVLFRAERAGVLSEVQEILGTKSREAAALQKSVRGGKSFFETAVKFARAKPWAAAAIGAGVAAAAVLTLKPLSWVSGDDDDWNTIEGLPHGVNRGDFGSGWKGLFDKKRKRGKYHRRRGHTRRGYWYKGRWVEKKWIKDHFVKQNENAFEGFGHSGFSAATRRENTDFGSGFRALDFGGLISEQIADQKITEQEWRRMVRSVRAAQDQEMVLQILDRDEARRAFNRQLRWRDPRKASRIKSYLTERDQLGAFGSFNFKSNILKVGGFVDPRDVSAGGFLPLEMQKTEANERYVGELLYNWLSPRRVEETILHEGLHAIWSNDMDPVHKARFIQEAEAQLGGWFSPRGPDVSALAAKAPAYADVIWAAEKTGRTAYVDWVANEMFAHRGAALAYSGLGYQLGDNPELDAITGQYVQPGPQRPVDVRFEKFDPEDALREFFSAESYRDALRKHRETILPKGAGVQFSRARGLPTELMGVPIDPEILDFRRRMQEPGERARIRKEIEERSAALQAKMGEFGGSDLFASGVADIEALNQKRKDLRVVNLRRFAMEVEDADTIVLKRRGLIPSIKSLFGYGDIHVRLAGIDAPEVSGHKDDPLAPFRIWQDQPAGTKAAWALKDLLAKQDEVKLVVSEEQKTYGRYLGVLANEEGTNINMQLLRGGAVSALPFGPRKTDILLREQARAAEETARVHRRGMWSYARYQATHIAERYIGRNLTHNTLTRLDKLAGNLNVGAYGSFLNSFGAQQRELTFEEIATARRLGRALKRTHGPPPAAGAQTFSGKDDAHLQIEGLGHEGIAWQIRQAMTDFGSGYEDSGLDATQIIGIGMSAKALSAAPNVVGNIRLARAYARGYLDYYHGTPMSNLESILEKGIQPNAADFETAKKANPIVLDPVGRARMAALEEKATHVYGSADQWVSRAHATMDPIAKGATPAEVVAAKGPYMHNQQKLGGLLGYYHPDVRGGQGTGAILEMRIPMDRLTPQKGVAAQWGALTGSEAAGKAIGTYNQAFSTAAIPTLDLAHKGAIKPGEFLRYSETATGKIVELGGKAAEASAANWGQVAKRSAMAAAPLALLALGLALAHKPDPLDLRDNRVASREAHTFDGMQHRGVASELRKQNTDFGSKWNALRGLTRAGETFAEMLAGSEFKAALSQATKKRTLGSGVYGEVAEMAGTFRGQQFRFARKTALPGHAIAESEIQIMRELEAKGFGSVPTVYSSGRSKTGQVLDIELFEGHTLAELGPQSAELFQKRTIAKLREMHSLGVEHMDPHLGNVMLVRTPSGAGEIGIIDYGFARRFKDVGQAGERAAFGKYDIAFFDEFLLARQQGAGFQAAYGRAAKKGISETGGKGWDASAMDVDSAFDDMFGEVQEVMAAGSRRPTLSQVALNVTAEEQVALSRIKGLPKSFNVEGFEGMVPKRGSAANSFDGMDHRGLSSHLRKKNTDFGSRWNALRGLIRAGETFEKMIAGSEFKAALAAGKQIRHIPRGPGGGAFSDVFIMESSFRGKQFKFVRKVGEIGEHEAAAMRAGAGEMLPNVYSVRKTGAMVERGVKRHKVFEGTLEMEYFEGKTLGELQSSGRITADSVREVQKKAKDLYRAQLPGWHNPDLNPGNIMLIPGNKDQWRIGLIDQGLATPTGIKAVSVPPPLPSTRTVEIPLPPSRGPQTHSSLLETMAPKSEKQRKLIEMVTKKKLQQAQAQLATQRAASEAAIRGGQGHKTFKTKV